MKNRKILIVGWGREGESTYRFLRKRFPENEIGGADQSASPALKNKLQRIKMRDRNFNFFLGRDYLKKIGGYDVIFRSPAVPLHLLAEKLSGKNKQQLTSQTELFLRLAGDKTIGVTGTKGKSTTAALLSHILTKAGWRVELSGNIGRPPLDFFNRGGRLKRRDFFVLELSSHQLAGLKISPRVAVLLNITPEHLDYYVSFKQYAAAKANITRFQQKDDLLIYCDYELPRRIAARTKARTWPCSLERPVCPGYYLCDHRFVFCQTGRKTSLLSTVKLPLLGRFNLNNVLAAAAVAHRLGIAREKIRRATESFKPLPHRLERVGIYRGIVFYNDALATTPEATIGAIEALAGRVGTIILGGSERRQDFQPLAESILRAGVKKVILLPETGRRVWAAVKTAAARNHQPLPGRAEAGSMAEAVELCYRFTAPGAICLLSTAAPSFSLFRDYQEKGGLFRRYVKQLGGK